MNKYSFFTISIAILALLSLIFFDYLTTEDAFDFISSIVDKISSVLSKISLK